MVRDSEPKHVAFSYVRVLSRLFTEELKKTRPKLCRNLFLMITDVKLHV
jgi:hypothetical protein